MKIQSIQSAINFGTTQTYKQHQQPKKQHSPIHDSLSTAGAWFGFGIGFDLLSRKLQFSKSPMKNSLAINSVLGTGAGIVTGIQSQRKIHKSLESNN